MKINEAWEDLDRTEATIRLKVFGGWIVQATARIDDHISNSLCFVPDPRHEWKLK